MGKFLGSRPWASFHKLPQEVLSQDPHPEGWTTTSSPDIVYLFIKCAGPAPMQAALRSLPPLQHTTRTWQCSTGPPTQPGIACAHNNKRTPVGSRKPHK